jgi:hypothetical protein
VVAYAILSTNYAKIDVLAPLKPATAAKRQVEKWRRSRSLELELNRHALIQDRQKPLADEGLVVRMSGVRPKIRFRFEVRNHGEVVIAFAETQICTIRIGFDLSDRLSDQEEPFLEILRGIVWRIFSERKRRNVSNHQMAPFDRRWELWTGLLVS